MSRLAARQIASVILFALFFAYPGSHILGQLSILIKPDWVEIDTIVLDSQGKPVIHLRHEDFRVFEDGVERPLKAFAFEKVQPGNLEVAKRLHEICADLKDPGTFYSLVFLSQQSKPDGKLHTVRIECRRTGVRLCYRKSYIISALQASIYLAVALQGPSNPTFP
jgi:hypothetical protein